jgi:hypothetical protein
MRNGTLCLSTLLAAFALSGPVRANDAVLGKKVRNVTFHDAAGKTTALHDLTGKKAIVIVFLSFECPVSNNYTQPLADLAKQYADIIGEDPLGGENFLDLDDRARLAEEIASDAVIRAEISELRSRHADEQLRATDDEQPAGRGQQAVQSAAEASPDSPESHRS